MYMCVNKYMHAYIIYPSTIYIYIHILHTRRHIFFNLLKMHHESKVYVEITLVLDKQLDKGGKRVPKSFPAWDIKFTSTGILSVFFSAELLVPRTVPGI